MSGRDPLDDAIDRVATRLVSIDGDASLAQRIASSLPERGGRGWVGFWSLQVAALASLLLTVTYFGVSSPVDDPPAASVQSPVVTTANAPEPTSVRKTDVSPMVVPARRTRAAAAVATAPPAFELAPIEGPGQLTVATLTSSAMLAPLEPAMVPPISVSELSLAVESLDLSQKE